jgi:hypothetical protein
MAQQQQRGNSALTTPSPSVTYEHAPSPFMNQFLLNRDLFQEFQDPQPSRLTPVTPTALQESLETQDTERLKEMYIAIPNKPPSWGMPRSKRTFIERILQMSTS